MRPAILLGATISLVLAGPASAAVLLPGSSNTAFTGFDASTQGTLLDWKRIQGVALTFTGDLRAAVYRNTLGTLDFYYQVQRTAGGEIGSDDIRSITAANFGDFGVEALFSDVDLDGSGIFTTANNGGGLGTGNRNTAGGVIGVNLDSAAALSGTETSATYIFRTTARTYSDRGTFGVSDGATFSGRAFQPTGVPEAGTWAMLLFGFAGIGTALRRNRARVAIA